jgi:hypothetical protein
MKKVLAVVIAVAFIGAFAVSSNAQVPNIQIYFDDLLQATQGDCADHFSGELDQLNVVMNNFNMFVSSVEFGTDFGLNFPVTWLGDVHNPGAINLGNSPTGVAISFPIPQNAFGPFVCMRMSVLWQCDSCVGQPVQTIAVVPHPGTGFVRAVEFNTFRTVVGVGMTSAVCPGPVSTEESSWGQIKALYGN